ncbi:MAG: twin-arginine translocase TatA/TatE family subunit [Bdellovibrionia bacterium]
MNLGFTEILFLMVIILLFFGPSKLPGMGKSLGEAIRSFKKSMDGMEIDVTETSKKPKKTDEEPGKDV